MSSQKVCKMFREMSPTTDVEGKQKSMDCPHLNQAIIFFCFNTKYQALVNYQLIIPNKCYHDTLS